ncbi:MAG: DNA (cytosine-5-)-methyltransferase [Pseudomonadota bacterium]
MRRYFEFFAGGGMARAGLTAAGAWRCRYANDVDPEKAEIYRSNWGDAALQLADVAAVAPGDLPGRADLVWASFPCQDLSLAGGGGGLGGRRSSAFWPFWRLMRALREEGRGPKLIALENVCGAMSSAGGRDFAALIEAFAALDYSVGAVVIDAAHFVPQSRPRLFVIGAAPEIAPGVDLGAGVDAAIRADPDPLWHPAALRRAVRELPSQARARWVWWRLPEPPRRNTKLDDLLEPDGAPIPWRSPAQTQALLSLMAPGHRDRIEAARGAGGAVRGTVFRRTRRGPEGRSLQRAEVRFDGVAGCLRTPAGGSSRQTLIEVRGPSVRTRLLTPRETARLMGLDDDFALPRRATAAYHLTGDGVAAPVVRWLADRLFEPLLAAEPQGGAGVIAAE